MRGATVPVLLGGPGGPGQDQLREAESLEVDLVRGRRNHATDPDHNEALHVIIIQMVSIQIEPNCFVDLTEYRIEFYNIFQFLDLNHN